MIEFLYFVGFLVAVVASAVFSGTETGFYAISRLRLRFYLWRGERGARHVNRMLADPQMLLSSILIGNNISLYFATFLTQVLLIRLESDLNPELVSSLLLTPVLFVVAEAVPKNAFRLRSDPLLYVVAPWLYVFTVVVRPLAWLLTKVVEVLTSWIGVSEVGSRDSLTRRSSELLFFEGHEEGWVSPVQQSMAKNIIGLQDVVARSVMIPIDEAKALEVSTDRRTMMDIVRGESATRFLVYKEQRDLVLGMVHIYDLLFDDDRVLNLESRLRPAMRISPAMPLDDLLTKLKDEGQHLAVVEGPDGEALGLVTTKDVVQEIVGELSDL